jgi:hypothetical protein
MSIAARTPFLPGVIADCICDDSGLPDARKRFSVNMVKAANAEFKRSATFRESITPDTVGRKALYRFLHEQLTLLSAQPIQLV